MTTEISVMYGSEKVKDNDFTESDDHRYDSSLKTND